jgi:hypothetical protein
MPGRVPRASVRSYGETEPPTTTRGTLNIREVRILPSTPGSGQIGCLSAISLLVDRPKHDRIRTWGKEEKNGEGNFAEHIHIKRGKLFSFEEGWARWGGLLRRDSRDP